MKHSFIILSILIFLTPVVTMAVPVKWNCGKWTEDKTGKCEEERTCTRTVCDTTNTISGCRYEKRTECADPIPPKTTTPSSLLKGKLIFQNGSQKVKEVETKPHNLIPKSAISVPVLAPTHSKPQNKKNCIRGVIGCRTAPVVRPLIDHNQRFIELSKKTGKKLSKFKIAPKNAICKIASKNMLTCRWNRKTYQCNRKRKNCIEVFVKSYPKFKPAKMYHRKNKLNKGVMYFDEADALFGKRTER